MWSMLLKLGGIPADDTNDEMEPRLDVPAGMDMVLTAIIAFILYTAFKSRIAPPCPTQGKGKGKGNGKGKDKGKGEDADSKPAPSLFAMGCLVAVAAIISNLIILIWMIVELDLAGKGKIGEATAVADTIKARFPYLFVFFTKIFLLPTKNTQAAEYYAQQRPFFMEAAKNFKIHPYFTHTTVPEINMRYPEIIHARVKAMAHLQLTEGRDDFKIEKDKCVMSQFLENNNIAQCNILHTFRERETLLSALKDPKTITEWPVFIKACHLTQSSSQGTRAVVSHKELSSKATADWINEKWDFRANDFEREWCKEGNLLTQDLTPGFLIQAGMPQSDAEEVQQTTDVEEGVKAEWSSGWEVQGRFSVGLSELRVEVLWGRAYLALLDGAYLFQRDGSQHDFSTWRALFKTSVPPGPRTSWITDGGYMECVWRTAERVAKAAGIDAIRVDIFLRRGSPGGCMVNEDSLSSGLIYFGHDDYIAKLWAEPHTTKEYGVLDTNKPVYELTPSDTGLE